MKVFYSIFLFSTLFLLSTNHIKAQELVYIKAQSGDGIHRLLQKQDMDSEEYFQEFIELNKTKLLKGNHLIVGVSYAMPSNKTIKTGNFYEIFGEKYGQIDGVDGRLKGAIYYLVSGHGGPDPGAIGKKNGHLLAEDEYAYDISLRLGRELITHGAIVYIIVRDPDDGIRDDTYLKNDKHETVWKEKEIPLNLNKKLKQRTQVVNQLYAENKGLYQRLIVMHIDSRSVSERVDAFAYYNSKSRSGKLFTERIINALKDNYRKYQPQRSFDGISKARNGLYMVKYTHPVTSYLELGNIQNPKDQQRFLESSNRQALAEWIAIGCIDDYNH